MYLFFTVCGFLFVAISSIIINYIYDIFPINKVTVFLKPLDRASINKFNITLIPILLWSYIELPMLITNKYFVVSVLANSFISCVVMYIIKNSSYLINRKTENVTEGIAIVIATVFGQLIGYLFLLMGADVISSALIQGLLLLAYSIGFVYLRLKSRI